MGYTKIEAQQIADQVKSEKELLDILERERDLRSEQANSVKAAHNAAKKEYRTNVTAYNLDKDFLQNSLLAQQIEKKYPNNSNIDALYEKILSAIKRAIANGLGGPETKSLIVDAVKNFDNQFNESFTKTVRSFLGSEKQGGPAFLQEIQDMMKDAEQFTKTTTGRAFAQAQRRYRQMGEEGGGFNPYATSTIDIFRQRMEQTKRFEEARDRQQEKVNNYNGNEDEERLKAAQAAKTQAEAIKRLTDQKNKEISATIEATKQQEKLNLGFNSFFNRIAGFLSVGSIFATVRMQINKTKDDIKQLDKAFASIAYVSNETVKDLWGTYTDYATMAEKLGQSTVSVIKASSIYRQQGLDTAKSLELTTETMKLATIAGNDYATATKEMTAALRGFKMEMDEGGHVSDVYSELAAHAAASVDDIAKAMTRTASIGA